MEPLYETESLSQKNSETATPRHSRLQTIGVAAVGIFAFFFFLLFKLPEARIQNFIIGHLRIISQDQGFLFSAEKVRIGILLGPTIKLYNVELKSIDDEKQILKIDYLRLRPQLTSLVTGSKRVSIAAELLGGEISGEAGIKNTGFLADLDISTLNLGAATLLKKFIPLEMSALLEGKIRVNFDSENIQKSDGAIKLSVSKFNSTPQMIAGFNLPKLTIGETKIDIEIGDGKLTIKNFQVGKDLKTDDLVAKVSGDGKLEPIFERSRINAKVSFELSPSVIQSFPLIDALLGSAKTPDGKYGYRLSGTLFAPEATPGN